MHSELLGALDKTCTLPHTDVETDIWYEQRYTDMQNIAINV